MRQKQHSRANGLSTTVFRSASAASLALANALALVLALAVFSAGCGYGSAAKDPAGGLQLAMSDVSRLAPDAPQGDLDSASTSMEQFGADLYGVLAKNVGTGNLVFSPSSIETALAMTYAGAKGVTADEMARVLHFALQGDALHQAFNSLDRTLESRNFTEEDYGGKQIGVVVRTADSLWGQTGFTFEQPFLETLAANYGAGMRLVDFEDAPEKARQAINAWVAEQTADKIPELAAKGSFDNLHARLVLVNAIYLDATWMSQFSPASTTDGQFTTLAGAAVTAPMMRQTSSLRYGQGDGWQAVELPYARDQLGMLLVVPDQGRFAQAESALQAGSSGEGLIEQAVASLGDYSQVTLTLPKFTFRTHVSLADALRQLGMPTAFGDAADFSGMTTQEPLFIGDVIHEAYIAVDEEGTEAAAATAVTMVAGSAMTEPLRLTIDRPFFFAVRDLETGELLFFGRVADPTT